MHFAPVTSKDLLCQTFWMTRSDLD